jgi:hypothetical protein
MKSKVTRWEGMHRYDIIKLDIRRIVWEDVEWMHLAQDGYQWRALVNTITNLGVLRTVRNLLTS